MALAVERKARRARRNSRCRCSKSLLGNPLYWLICFSGFWLIRKFISFFLCGRSKSDIYITPRSNAVSNPGANELKSEEHGLQLKWMEGFSLWGWNQWNSFFYSFLFRQLNDKQRTAKSEWNGVTRTTLLLPLQYPLWVGQADCNAHRAAFPNLKGLDS